MRTINLKDETFGELVKRKGFLEIKYKENFSMDKVVNWLLDHSEDIIFPIDETEGIYIDRESPIEKLERD